MNGKIVSDLYNNPRAVYIELTRRNLYALIAKLDGSPQDSARTITKTLAEDILYSVTAVEDEAHYSDTPPGRMHYDTERAISNHYAQDEDDEPCHCGHCKRGGE